MSSDQRIGRDQWITSPLNRLSHRDFIVSVRILRRGAAQPRRAAVTAGVIDWLDGLDADEVEGRSTDDYPRFASSAGDWEFELRAIPVRRDARGREGRGLVGIYPGSGGWDNTGTALRAALKEKARKYGRPEEPLVLAPLLTSGFVDVEDCVEDCVEALFGTEAVTFDPASPEHARTTRMRDGFWAPGDGFRGTRVSGVLIGDAILPWVVATRLPRLWIHPGAARPSGLFPTFRSHA